MSRILKEMLREAIRRLFVTETVVAGTVVLVGATLTELQLIRPWPVAIALVIIVGGCAWLFRQRFKSL